MKALRKLIREEFAKFYGKDTTNGNGPAVPISKPINEAKPLVEPTPKNLKTDNKTDIENLGDPLKVKLNTQTNETGSDEKNMGVVSVKAGSPSSKGEMNSGQRKPNFQTKKQAPVNNFGAKQKRS